MQLESSLQFTFESCQRLTQVKLYSLSNDLTEVNVKFCPSSYVLELCMSRLVSCSVVLILASSRLCVCQFIPLVMHRGAPHAYIEVDGATNNPQMMMIDTGSSHSYVLSHRMIGQFPRAQGRRAESIRGYRSSLITSNMVSHADESQVDYTGFAGLRLLRWTRKQFHLGDRVWNQKFAVAELPEYQIEDARPDDAHGLIGAEPASRFTLENPIYGFKPNYENPNLISMFFEPIRPEWCRNNHCYNAPISGSEHWTVWGKVETLSRGSDDTAPRSNYVLADRFELLIDSGTGRISLPRALYEEYREYLARIVPLIEITRGYMTTSFANRHLIPPFKITFLDNGPSLIIPSEKFASCVRVTEVCYIFVGVKDINPFWITLGEPLFQSFITVFDSRAQTIGFCEPLESTFAEPLFIPGPPQPPPPPSEPTRGDVVVVDDDRLPGRGGDVVVGGMPQLGSEESTISANSTPLPPPPPAAAVVVDNSDRDVPNSAPTLPPASLDANRGRDIPSAPPSPPAPRGMPLSPPPPPPPPPQPSAPPQTPVGMALSPQAPSIAQHKVAPPKPLLTKQQQSMVSLPIRKKSIFDVPPLQHNIEILDKRMTSPLRLPDDIVEEPLPGDTEKGQDEEKEANDPFWKNKQMNVHKKEVFKDDQVVQFFLVHQLIFICIILII